MAKKPKQSKYSTQFVPIREIKSGIIILDNGYQVTGVKIMPRNIFILDQATQYAVISNLRNVYNTIDFEFWMIAADRPVDINNYLSQLQVLYTNNSSPIKRKLILDDIKKGNDFMNSNVVDTEYFILFKEKDINLINKRIRTLISTLAGAGLVAYQTTNEDLRTILDNFLNGGQTTTFGAVIG